MAQIETWFSQDLKQPVKVQYLNGNVFSQDNQGNLVGVNVFDDGEPAVLSGTVTGYVIRSDGATVPVNGVLNGSSCYVILNSSCYAVEGTLSLVIKLSYNNATTTLCAVVAYVYRSTTDAAVDPGTIIPSVQELIDAINEAVESIPSDYSDFYTKYKKNVDNGFLLLDNAFPPYDSELPKTSNGITFTKLSNGGIGVSGTATGTATFIINQNFSIPADVKKVVLSGCPANGNDSTYRLSLAKTTGIGTYENLIADIGNGAEYVIEDHSFTYTLVIRIGEGTAINDIFYPSLQDAYTWGNKKLTGDLAYDENLISLPYYDTNFTNRSGVDAVGKWDGSVILSSAGTNTGNVNYYVKTDFVFPPDVRKARISGCPKTADAGTKYCVRVGLYNANGSGTTGWSTIATDNGDGAEFDVLPNGKYLICITTLPGQAYTDVSFLPEVTNVYRVSLGEIEDSIFDNVDVHFIKISSNSYRGDCVLVAGKYNGLIDLGYDSNCTTLISKLSALRINKPDFVVLTHYHSDHITSNFPVALDNMISAGIDFTDCIFYLPHKGIDWNSFVGDNDNRGAVETVVINKLDALNIKHIHPDNNQVFKYSKDFSVRFFNIGNYSSYYEYFLSMNSLDVGYTNYNSFSMITEITAHGKKIVLASDITPIAQHVCYPDLNGCDVYKIEHHGLNNDTDDAWLNILDPQYSIIQNYSGSYTDIFTATRKSVFVLSQRSSVFSTLDGDVVVSLFNNGITIRGGSANTVGYGNKIKNALYSIASDYIVKANESIASPIVSAQSGYFEISGKYVELSGVVYFTMVLHCLSDINTGLSNITSSLPAPEDESVVFDEVSGFMNIASLSYSSGWRVNGRHNQNDYCFVSGIYKKAVM